MREEGCAEKFFSQCSSQPPVSAEPPEWSMESQAQWSGSGVQRAGDHSASQPQEACVGTQKSIHPQKGLDSFGFSAANCQPGLSYCSVPTWPCFPGLRLIVGNFHQLEAEGSLERVWRLPLSAPVTNHRLPLELLPRSFWEMVSPVQNILQWLFKGKICCMSLFKRGLLGEEATAADFLKVIVRLFVFSIFTY